MRKMDDETCWSEFDGGLGGWGGDGGKVGGRRGRRLGRLGVGMRASGRKWWRGVMLFKKVGFLENYSVVKKNKQKKHQRRGKGVGGTPVGVGVMRGQCFQAMKITLNWFL